MASFEHQGVWWEPGHPERQRVGTLRFGEREGATLTLIVPPDQTGFEPPLESYEVLHGRSTSGERISLLKCFDQSTKGSFGDQPRPIEVFVNEVIVGFHCDSTDPLLGTASATFRHLQPWLGKSGIEIEPPTSPRDVSLRYQSSPPIVLHEDDRYVVSITSGWTGLLSHAEVTVREGVHLEVKAKTPARLSELRRVLSACGDLLSICCQRFCAMDELVLLPPAVESQPRQLGTHHAVPIYSDRDKSYSPADTLVPVAALSGRMPDVFSRFIRQAATLHDVRALYLSGVYGGGFVENKLIALTQAAEAFHRRFHDGEYMAGEAFAVEVVPALKAAIPKHLPSDHRASLLARLTYGHEYSQRKRLGELFEAHEGTLRVLTPHPMTFVRRMIDHRNTFTHFPAGRDDNTPDESEPEVVLRYNFLLKLLLEACCLQVAGLSVDQIEALARGSYRLKQIAGRFFAAPTGLLPPPAHSAGNFDTTAPGQRVSDNTEPTARFTLVHEAASTPWRIEVRDLARLRDVIGHDTLVAFCRCFVHANRLTSLVSSIHASEKLHGPESVAFARDLDTLVWFGIGTLRELSRSLRACRASLENKGLWDDSIPGLVHLKECERRWADGPLAIKMRNKGAYHVDPTVVSDGLDGLLTSIDPIVLSRGQGPKAHASVIVLGNDSLFRGLGIELAEYRQFLEQVASDLSIGESIQQAFIEIAKRAGAAYG